MPRLNTTDHPLPRVTAPPEDTKAFNLWAGRDRNAVCLECGANFLNPWDHALGYCGLMCAKDPGHQGIQQSRRGVTRWLREPDGTLKEYDIMTQQPVTETGLVKWEVAGRIVQMDRHQARTICPTATDDQIEFFLQYAAHMGLDPWAKEIMLIPFGGNTGPPTIYVGKEAYIRRAEAHPDLDYFAAGTIVIDDKTGELKHNNGESVYPGQTLWGAWCDVKRRSRSNAFQTEVMLSTYNRKQSNWNDKPEMMIRKVAICHGLHESFPGLLDYRPANATQVLEIQPDIGNVVEGQIRDLPDADAPEPGPATAPTEPAPVSAKAKGQEIGPAVREYAFEKYNMDLAGIGKALGAAAGVENGGSMRLQLFLEDHTGEQVYKALDDYAKMTGAKPPTDAKQSPEPSDAPLFEEAELA